MTPYFETVKSFADVPIGDDGIDTSAFLEASDGLVLLFDLLGNGVFAFVQNDIRSNIAGVRERFNAHRDASGTLESLVVCEKQNHVPPAPLKGIPCLVRLIRGLAFSCKALQNMQEDRHCDLHICFKRSYDAVLRHHHNFAIRAVVAIAIRAVPRRDDFYHRIAQGGSKEKLDAELTKWLCGLDTIVSRMTAFLQDGGYGRV
ncbi:glycolipid transfer protein [Fistulina hepatica ATCC 64428]|uniref:Glycolipid transfer protein n=1 Tax=Fistulina hepatica ATCC 64428 TaxID=1128425 RepID=A0A0D7AP58_9AGAR|nr:glycolipid transfer protein [Fistulina hepatica ATCC 64428]